MKTQQKAAALATVFLAAGLVAAPAQAKTTHCDPGLGKYEVNTGPSIHTDLRNGTPVCIKAGNEVYETRVMDGMITNDEILNRNDKAKGISYFVVYPCDDQCEEVS